MKVLEEELATYERLRAELVAKHDGKHVLIYGSEVRGVYDSRIEAVRDGRARFGNVPIFVRKIAEKDEVIFLPIWFVGDPCRS